MAVSWDWLGVLLVTVMSSLVIEFALWLTVYRYGLSPRRRSAVGSSALSQQRHAVASQPSLEQLRSRAAAIARPLLCRYRTLASAFCSSKESAAWLR